MARADAVALDLVPMTDVPKDIFELKRTYGFLEGVRKAIDRLKKNLEREPQWPKLAAEFEIRAMVCEMLGKPDKAEHARRLRDKAVQRQMAIRKSISRRRRIERPKDLDSARRRETPVDQKAVREPEKPK